MKSLSMMFSAEALESDRKISGTISPPIHSPNPFSSVLVEDSIAFTLLDIGKRGELAAGVAMRLQLRKHGVEFSNVILHLDDETLWARNKNDANVDEFAIVLQLSLFELDERIVGAAWEARSIAKLLRNKS